jgi:sigma-B regulation protein RsbU (phosphoserine phosphatase)
MNILVVDDDPVDRACLRAILGGLGHKVLECRNADSAWSMLTRTDVSVVVSDWMMPGCSGLDLCRRIRTAGSGKYVYVILCTARGERTDYIEGMDAGADDFLVKPVFPEELRVRVRAAERIVSLEKRLAARNRQLESSNAQLRKTCARIEADVQAAAWMQENLLPPPDASVLGVRCNWRFRPSHYVAGDMFNFFALDERHVGFYLLDVAGHGLPAAVNSVALSMILSPDGPGGGPLKRFDPTSNRFAPADTVAVLQALNRRFESVAERHFAISYGVFDSQASLLRLAQAGNPNPLLIESCGEVRRLTTGGTPVGLWPDIDIDYVELPFEPGNRLVLYSDGITECTNRADEEFGDLRVMRCLACGASDPADLMLNRLQTELEDWRGSTIFSDDLSMLAVELAEQEMV